MRTLVFEGLQNIFVIFPIVWLILFFSVITFGVLKHTGRLTEKGERWFKRYLLGGIGSFIFFAIVLGFSSKYIVYQDYVAAFARTPKLIEFELENRKVLITDEKEIRRFKDILAAARSVGAHHSHPTREIKFRVDGCSSIFFLGRDSANKDEFWFKVQNKEYGPGEHQLDQFRTTELEDWLKKL